MISLSKSRTRIYGFFMVFLYCIPKMPIIPTFYGGFVTSSYRKRQVSGHAPNLHFVFLTIRLNNVHRDIGKGGGVHESTSLMFYLILIQIMP